MDRLWPVLWTSTVALLATFDVAAAQSTEVSGTLVRIWVDGPRGGARATPLVAVVDAGGRLTLLNELSDGGGADPFSAVEDGSVVRVRGEPLSNAAGTRRSLRDVEVIEVRAVRPRLTAALQGARPLAVVACRFADRAAPFPLSALAPLYTGTLPGGLDHYWREVSNGQLSLAGSALFGWFDLPGPYSHYLPEGLAGSPAWDRLTHDCVTAADPAIDFRQFEGLVLTFSGDIGGGIAGTSYGNAGYPIVLDGEPRFIGLNWMAGLSAPVTLGGAAHEVGHMFGLYHSSGDYAQTYDSMWDVMSFIWRNEARPQHTIAHHKDALGFLPSARTFSASPDDSVVVRLERTTAPGASGSLLARIPILGGAGEHYTLEARQLVQHDSILPGAGVIIHRVNPTRSDRLAQVVDADRDGDPNDDGAIWLPGEVFEDAAAGVRVRVLAASGTGYEVAIITGATRVARRLGMNIVGAGEVTILAGSISRCTVSCELIVGDGTVATLVATPAAGHAIAGWSGDCAARDSSNRCWLTLSADRSATITFVPAHRATLRVSGLGAVYAFTGPHPSPGEIFGCDPRWLSGTQECDPGYGNMPADSVIDFFQYPAGGWSYGAWGGDCVGAAVRAVNWCQLVATAPRSVAVAFSGGSTLAIDRSSSVDSVGFGSVVARRDSVRVDVTGAVAPWVASTPAPWIELTGFEGASGQQLAWERRASGLAQGLHVAVIQVAVAAAAGSPAFFFDSLFVGPPLSASIIRESPRDSVLVGSSLVITDSASVLFVGTGSGNVGWTATARVGSWLTIESPEGAGNGKVRWRKHPSGLPVGSYRDTIVVAGPAGEPTALIVDTLTVMPRPVLSLPVTGRSDSLLQASGEVQRDSVLVSVTGFLGSAQPWAATTAVGQWLTLVQPTGSGSAYLKWTRTVGDLSLGVHVDTITVDAPDVDGSPRRIIDSLLVVRPVLSVTASSRHSRVTLGNPRAIPTTLTIGLSGLGSASADWVVTHGSAVWNELDTLRGVGAASAQWTRRTQSLQVGVYVDTILVSSDAAIGGPILVLDSLTVFEPAPSASCLVNDVLGGTCLDVETRTFLDDTGNRDGVFNLGDALAWLDRKGVAFSIGSKDIRASGTSVDTVGASRPDRRPRSRP